MAIEAARVVIERAVADRIFPAASIEIGGSAGVVWQDALGRLSFDAGSAAASGATIFDLASLTKPVATATVILRLVERGRLSLHDRVANHFEEWRGGDREAVTIKDLLEHASGLAARLVDPAPGVRREFEHDICTMPLESAPRSTAIYSDLGFILLGFLAADRGDAGLDALFAEALGAAGRIVELSFHVPAAVRSLTAPTKPLDADRRRGRTLVAEVHDDYAAALGGVAGHAGLFGTAAAVGHFARALLRAARGDRNISRPLSPDLTALATRRSDVPGSSRALGWDTMLPTSSCGTRMSASAFGHVGFTGTSLWIDPDRDRYFVLLTNRVCGGGTVEQMREVRRAFHDALGDV